MANIVDASVFCGHWPFRRVTLLGPEALKEHLRQYAVSRAWVAATEAILCPDPMQANEPLFKGILGDDFFLPVAIIDPTLATWRRDAVRCLQKWGCRALKLLPNYHGYELRQTLPAAAYLLGLAREVGVPVCVQIRMTDERSHHPLMKVPGVPVADIVFLARRHPEVRFLACGAYLSELAVLEQAPNIWVETSFVEGSCSLAMAIEALGVDRLIFGSHSPFMYMQSEVAKLNTDPLDVPPDAVAAIAGRNADTIIGS